MTAGIAALALMLSSSLPSTWDDGRVPEGDNAYTVHAGEVRISLFGRSVVGLSDRVELATDLLFPVPALVFPHLQLKTRLVQTPHFALALDGGGGLGGVPLAGAGALPLPGAIVAGAGVGFAFAALQNLVLHGTLRLTHLAVTLTGGAFVVEGAIAGMLVGGGIGGGGAGAVAAPAGAGFFDYGPVVGAEVDIPFGAHDALVAEATAFWVARPVAFEAGNAGLLFPWVGYMHRFDVFTGTIGAYTLTDIPKLDTWKASKMPVGPFFNLAWTFGGKA